MKEIKKTKQEEDLIKIYAEGKFYLEFSEACDFLGIPRTSLSRTIDKFNLLSSEDVYYYKNRKLLFIDWVFEFWEKVESAKIENTIIENEKLSRANS